MRMGSGLGDGPFDMLRPVLMAGQDNLLRPPRLGLAEIDTVLNAWHRALGLQPKAQARGGAQQHGLFILRQAGGNVGVQVEADGEGLRGFRLDQILALKLFTIFRESEAAMVDGAEELAPAVMAGLDPAGSAGILPGHAHILRAAAEAAFLDLGGGGVGDDKGGMRRCAAQGGAQSPARAGAAPQFTISRSLP